jgi:hypothetical protein
MWTDGHDEANSSFFAVLWRRLKRVGRMEDKNEGKRGSNWEFRNSCCLTCQTAFQYLFNFSFQTVNSFVPPCLSINVLWCVILSDNYRLLLLVCLLTLLTKFFSILRLRVAILWRKSNLLIPNLTSKFSSKRSLSIYQDDVVPEIHAQYIAHILKFFPLLHTKTIHIPSTHLLYFPAHYQNLGIFYVINLQFLLGTHVCHHTLLFFFILLFLIAVPWLRGFAAHLSQPRHEFDPRLIHLGFVSDEVTVG